jgi:Asp-tRNA(Asn)/Glu-tRNA(Gln) amidotransferase A subunit family amidase
VGAPARRLRIAWTLRAPNGAPVDLACQALVREIAALCAEIGHDVSEADPDIDRDAVVPTFLTLAAANAAVNVRTHPTAGRPPRRGEVENVTFDTAARGDQIAGPDYVRATQAAHRLGRQMAAFHRSYDVLLTPGIATPGAVKLGWIDMMLEDMDEYWRRVFEFSPFTVWFNITGQPAIMLPVGQVETAGAPRGLPLAIQLVARFGDEATLFRLSAQIEAARPWIDRKPAIAG